MKILLVTAILFCACGGSNNSKPTTTDTAKPAPVVSAPVNPVIGTPKKLGSIEVAAIDLPDQMIWEQARVACKELGAGWRLPTKEELNELYLKQDSIGGFTKNLYWSSSDDDTLNVYTKHFSNGNGGSFSKIYTASTRAVRTF